MLKKKVLAKVVSQVSELQSPVEIDISSRVKQLTRILQLKDILETSEGRQSRESDGLVEHWITGCNPMYR